MSGWSPRGCGHEGWDTCVVNDPQRGPHDRWTCSPLRGGGRVGARGRGARRHPSEHRQTTPGGPASALGPLSTEQLIYRGRAEGWLSVPSLEPT